MDPITRAAKQLHADIDAFWNPHPGAPIAAGPRVLRLVISPSERGDLLKALRWLEWSPTNRRPVILFEEAFEDEPRYLRALVTKTANDGEAVRKGLAEGGVLLTLPLASPADAVLDATTARRYLDAAAACVVNGSLDGLFVVVVPERVAAPNAYGATLAKLMASPIGPALRLVVLDIPGAELGALLPTEVRFQVDRAELFAFLKQIGPKPSAGPAIPKPSWSSALPSRHDAAVRRAAEVELRPLAAQALLGMAGIHVSRGRGTAARTAYETIARLTIDVPPLAAEAQRMQQQCRRLEHMDAEEAPRSQSHEETAIAH